MASQSAGIGSALPDQNGQSGNVLTTDGTVASWEAVGVLPGVTAVGTFSTTGIANGASISGATITFGPANGTLPGMLKALGSVGSTPAAAGASLGTDGTLTLQPADGSNPGVVTAGAQTLAGVKTFSSIPVALGFNGSGTSTAVGLILDTPSIGSGKVFSFRKNTFECFYIDTNGAGHFYDSVPTYCGGINISNAAQVLLLDGSSAASAQQIKMKRTDGTVVTLTVNNSNALVIT